MNRSEPQLYYLEDNGLILNNTLPLILYQKLIDQSKRDTVGYLEKLF